MINQDDFYQQFVYFIDNQHINPSILRRNIIESCYTLSLQQHDKNNNKKKQQKKQKKQKKFILI